MLYVRYYKYRKKYPQYSTEIVQDVLQTLRLDTSATRAGILTLLFNTPPEAVYRSP